MTVLLDMPIVDADSRTQCLAGLDFTGLDFSGPGRAGALVASPLASDYDDDEDEVFADGDEVEDEDEAYFDEFEDDEEEDEEFDADEDDDL